jgi:hypothetical protein
MQQRLLLLLLQAQQRQCLGTASQCSTCLYRQQRMAVEGERASLA